MRHLLKPFNFKSLRESQKKVTLGDATLHNLPKKKHALRGSIVNKRHQASPVTKRHQAMEKEVSA